MSPSAQMAPDLQPGLQALSLSLTRGCVGWAHPGQETAPQLLPQVPQLAGVEPASRQDSHANSDRVEGRELRGQTLPLMCTGLRKQPGAISPRPRGPGDERPRRSELLKGTHQAQPGTICSGHIMPN